MFEQLIEAMMAADVCVRPPTVQELKDLEPEELDRLGRRYLGRGIEQSSAEGGF